MKKSKSGKRSSKKAEQAADVGTAMLAKRHKLRPELSGPNGKVRVRVVDQDTLTLLYWRNKITDIQYSVGISMMKDLWKAGLTGKKSQNLESSIGSGYTNYIPYSVMPMIRFKKAVSSVRAALGQVAYELILSVVHPSNPPIDLSDHSIHILRQALDHVEKFYQTYSVTQALNQALHPDGQH